MHGKTVGLSLLLTSVLVVAWLPSYAEGRMRGKTVDDQGGLAVCTAGASFLRSQVRIMVGPSSSFPTRARVWGMQRVPLLGPSRIFGRTTSGCIAGAVALPTQGDGFIQRRPWRPTNFGHPSLIDYIQHLGEGTRRSGLGPLLVGDMSLPRGGAFMHGHFSHQTGLDVDIAYGTLISRPIRVIRRLGGPPGNQPPNSRRIEKILRLAASDARVDRIFVSVGIKDLLCRTVTHDREFLQVLRPWWGHERHFHIRLKCPADSPGCYPNQPASGIPDDCESLSTWWRSSEVQLAFARWRAADRAAYNQDLPSACQSLPAAEKMGSAPIPRHLQYANRRTDTFIARPGASMTARAGAGVSLQP
jgi:penicillin-insensitive murein endopeptidase